MPKRSAAAAFPPPELVYAYVLTYTQSQYVREGEGRGDGKVGHPTRAFMWSSTACRSLHLPYPAPPPPPPPPPPTPPAGGAAPPGRWLRAPASTLGGSPASARGGPLPPPPPPPPPTHTLQCCGGADGAPLGLYATAELARGAARRAVRKALYEDEFHPSELPDAEDFTEVSLKELRAACKARSLSGGRTGKKDELVEILDDHEFEPISNHLYDQYYKGADNAHCFEGGDFEESWDKDGSARIYSKHGGGCCFGPVPATWRVSRMEPEVLTALPVE